MEKVSQKTQNYSELSLNRDGLWAAGEISAPPRPAGPRKLGGFNGGKKQFRTRRFRRFPPFSAD